MIWKHSFSLCSPSTILLRYNGSLMKCQLDYSNIILCPQAHFLWRLWLCPTRTSSRIFWIWWIFIIWGLWTTIFPWSNHSKEFWFFSATKSYKSNWFFCLFGCLFICLFAAPAVGQPRTRLEQPHPHSGFGDIYMEPAHHHSKHKTVKTHHAHVACVWLRRTALYLDSLDNFL